MMRAVTDDRDANGCPLTATMFALADGTGEQLTQLVLSPDQVAASTDGFLVLLQTASCSGSYGRLATKSQITPGATRV